MEKDLFDILIYIIVFVGIIIFNVIKQSKKAAAAPVPVTNPYTENYYFDEEEPQTFEENEYEPYNNIKVRNNFDERIKSKMSFKKTEPLKVNNHIKEEKKHFDKKNSNVVNLRQAVIYSEILNRRYE